MDLTTLVGLLVGVGGIVLGNTLEDGHIGSLVQGTAAVIVFGGTIGATVVANRRQDLITGLRLLRMGFGSKEPDFERVADEINQLAKLARKESILAIEKKIKNMSSPYMQNVFRYMIDGVEPETLKRVFEPEMEMEEGRLEAGAKIWSDAGGFAPTIGIIGAVLGLIHVMGNITNTAELGKGIAVAFVATIYGIGSANLFFLPIANKIRSKIYLQTQLKRMTLEGALSIVSGLNPYLIEEKMRGYVRAAKS